MMNSSRWLLSILAGSVLIGSLPVGAEAAPSQRKPLPLKQKKVLFSSPEDTLDKKPCKGKWRVTVHCRDKLHYVKSNESRHDVIRPYIRNLGGGYVGVGSDQNFTLIAFAKSKFAFLMDYDPVVVWVNMIHRALVLKSPTRKEFISHWEAKNRKKTIRYLGKFYRKHKDRHKIVWVYKAWGGVLRRHFQRRRYRRIRWKKKGIVRNESWLSHEPYYQYIRMMFKTGRIRVMKGDLLRNKSLTGIGKVSHKLGMPIRVFYFSNAEQFWPYIKQFRKNQLSLFRDKKSVIVRTLASRRYRPALDYIWVYILQPGLHFHKKLKSKKTRSVWSLAKQMKKVSRGVYELGTIKKQ